MRSLFLIPLLALLPPAAAAVPPCACDRCVAAYGDIRSGYDVHRKIVSLIEAARPVAVFNVGDMVSRGASGDEWKAFAEITKGLRSSASYYAALGNHEKGGVGEFESLFHYPGNGRWYAAGVPGVRFLVLDYLSPMGKGSAQYDWLKGELGKPRGADKFVVVVMHKPLMSTGPHGRDKWPARRDLEKLFRARGVDLVISGHDHDYERLERGGLTQVVTGGGGAPLRPEAFKSPYSRVFLETYNYTLLSVCGGTLKLEAFDQDGKPIDSFTLKARAAGKPGKPAKK